MVSVSRAWREPSGFLACVAVGAESIEQNPRKRGSERALPYHYHCTPKGVTPENVLKGSMHLQVQASAAVKFGERWCEIGAAGGSLRQIRGPRAICLQRASATHERAEPLHR